MNSRLRSACVAALFIAVTIGMTWPQARFMGTRVYDADDPLLALDNVILAPHAICWTDELFRGNGQAACRSILDVAAGRMPTDVVNREVLDRPTLRTKLARYAG